MKKLMMLICGLMLFGATAYADKGEIGVGVNANYGTHIDNFGFGAKLQYGLSTALRSELSVNAFFQKNYAKNLDFNLNFHYVIPLGASVRFYPLAGLTLTRWSVDYDGKSGWDPTDWSISWNATRFGVNMGGGVEFDLLPNVVLNVEGKYQIVSDFDQAVISAGVAVRF